MAEKAVTLSNEEQSELSGGGCGVFYSCSKTKGQLRRDRNKSHERRQSNRSKKRKSRGGGSSNRLRAGRGLTV